MLDDYRFRPKLLPLYNFASSAMIYLLFLVLIVPTAIQAKDILKLNQGRSVKDIRSQYNFDILHKAMKITEPEFGDYEINVVSRGIPGSRLQQFVREGGIVNIAMAVTTVEWETLTVPIRIPIRRGILNYRLLMINKNNAESFENIKTIEELKEKVVGLQRHWSTWHTMNKLGYAIANAYSYEAIFGMLDKERFDYVPRGVHEIYDEINIRKSTRPNLMVEPRLALYIPAPFYVFVSPNEPRLIKRFELGLNRLADQGILKSMLNKHYAEFLKRADLKNRLILDVGNPYLPPETPLDRKDLWMNWDH